LHSAVAGALSSFTYLEVGSYLGGSLQAVMQDPWCARVLSIDPRPANPPDSRSGSWEYEDNSTAHMIELLDGLPDSDMEKLTTFEVGTDGMRPADLPVRPDYCFVDGEHTDEAVLRDARFCAEALDGRGIVAFHDYELVKSAIQTFVRDEWSRVQHAAVFSGNSSPVHGGGVLAVELGDRGLLRAKLIDKAIGSRWHSALWKLTRHSRSPEPFMAAWFAAARVDRALAALTQRRAATTR
jgi:predicted outer membrane repeat protein